MLTVNRSLIVLTVALVAMNVGLAAPVLDSGNTADIKEQDTNMKEVSPVNDLKITSPDLLAQAKAARSSSSEKLRRGLTNFVNQLNPATFFIPPQPPTTNNDPKLATKTVVGGAPQTSADAVAIVNEDTLVDSVIKRPNRHSRPVGGPLRWG